MLNRFARAASAVALFIVAGCAHAGLVTYNFTATVTDGGVLAPLLGSGIGPGSQVQASVQVDTGILPTGTATYALYAQAIVGGTVTAGGQQWSIGGSLDNSATVWNDEDIGGGTLFDGLWLQAPISGPGLNGLAPAYMGFVLFNYKTSPNNAITDTSLPLALSLADFASLATGSLAFASGDTQGRFALVIDSVSVSLDNAVPTPGTLPLLVLALAVLAFAVRRRQTVTPAATA